MCTGSHSVIHIGLELVDTQFSLEVIISCLILKTEDIYCVTIPYLFFSYLPITLTFP